MKSSILIVDIDIRLNHSGEIDENEMKIDTQTFMCDSRIYLK